MMSSGRGKAPTTKSGENNGRRQQSHRSHPTTKSNGTTKSDRSQPTTKRNGGEATTEINGSEAAKTVGRQNRHQVQHVGCPHRHPEAVRGFGLRFQDPRGHSSLLRFQEPCRSSVLAASHHARIGK